MRDVFFNQINNLQLYMQYPVTIYAYTVTHSVAFIQLLQFLLLLLSRVPVNGQSQIFRPDVE
jgi:hypothetical protein